MKFCMVTTFFPPHNFGGDGLFVRQLSAELAARGHEVDVVYGVDAWRALAGRSSVPPHEEAPPGVRVHRLESPLGRLGPLLIQQTGRPLFARAALERVLDRGFDVINFHNISLAGGPGVLRLGRAAKLYTLHEHWWVCPTHVLFKYTGELCTERACLRCTLAHGRPPQLWRASRRFMARCLEEVDLVLAPSRATAERHRAWMVEAGVSVPIELVPPYVPPLPPAAARPAGLPARYFLYVGRLTAAKGIGSLVDVLRARPAYPLVVVGGGELEAELRQRAPVNVVLAGRVAREELAAYYAGATALVFPSLCAETFGLSACEALSLGIPVVTSRCGGTEEIVAEGAGLVYGSEAELLAHLDRLWSDAALCQELGRRGARRYHELYTPEAYLERYLAAVESARESRRARSA
jgi:glycosyltransferase involved in cell wall biosynthesis